MEPALTSVLAKVALGAATLMPPAAAPERKPPELCVYLTDWDNETGKPVHFEQFEERRGNHSVEAYPRSLLTIAPGKTGINRSVKFEKVSDFFGNIIRTYVRLTPEDDKDEDVRLILTRYVDNEDGNFINISMSCHRHTRQVTASCQFFDKLYRGKSDSPFERIYLMISGSLNGKDGSSLNESWLAVQEIREAHVPPLLELAMRVVNGLIEEKKISQNAIPQDTQDMLEKVRLIKRVAGANQPPIVLHY